MSTESTTGAVEVMVIPERAGLDRVIVYWHNIEPGKGYVTITCYGNAWTGYFGAMSGRSIQQFFQAVDTAYLVSALGNAQWLMPCSGHHGKLARVIEAVKAALDVEDAAAAAKGAQ